MKIYVLTEYEPFEPGSFIRGIYENKEKAIAIMKRLSGTDNEKGYYQITEMETRK